MLKPTIHLNGTSRESLTSDLEETLQAICKAREALHAGGPNARDYYVQGDGAFTKAANEHLARDTKLKEVYDELMEILAHVTHAP